MTAPRREFRPLQAQEIARAFHDFDVDYLFIGKTGPFDVDLVFAPDGISSYAEARSRRVQEGLFSVASLRDIIASKRASGRQKDQIELPLLEAFRLEYERRHAPPLRSVADITRHDSRPG